MLILAASPSKICKIPQPAEIAVVPKTAELVIDTSQSLADIQGQGLNTINPYGYDKITHTNGFMAAEIGIGQTVELDAAPLPGYGAACLWYKKVTINIDIEPKIVIAKEVADDKCMYRAVLEHEMKHVNADRIVANKYAKTIGQKIFDGLEQRGFVVGPIAPDQMDAVGARMQETVFQLMDLETRKMDIERTERQQGIDSLEEYERVRALCPHYKPPSAKAVR